MVAFARRRRSWRRNEKNVGRIDLRGNNYDADFSRFERIGSLKKTRLSLVWLSCCRCRVFVAVAV